MGHETRLSQWHPYPAMVPDCLASLLAEAHVAPKSNVLDPFCGSGRMLMAAAERGARCVGLDVNPLACLITEAKAANTCVDTLAKVAEEARSPAVRRLSAEPIVLRGRRNVPWLSDRVASELGSIIRWINSLSLAFPERLVLAATLSAATRDSAWIRKGRWKLHRVPPPEREAWSISAWDQFSRRLEIYVSSARKIKLKGEVFVHNQPAQLATNVCGATQSPRFNVVLTSPPYGDSRTTVQYGAASSICLDVVTRLNGFENRFLAGSAIESSCLGGGVSRANGVPDWLYRYWVGGAHDPAAVRVTTFLMDFGATCRSVADAVAPGGTVVYVVGRRSVGGFRLRLDEFAVDQFVAADFSLLNIVRRRLHDKRLPRTINRFGRSGSAAIRGRGRTKTMDEEIVLTFLKGTCSA